MKLKPTAAPTLKNRGELWWCTDPEEDGPLPVRIEAWEENDAPGMEELIYYKPGECREGHVNDVGVVWYGPVEIPEVEE